MTAQVIDFRPRTPRGAAPLLRTRLPMSAMPTITISTEWWTHPIWCDRTCYGGHTVTWSNGVSDTTARRHYADTYRQTLTDVTDSNEIHVAAGVVCAEEPDSEFEQPAVQLELNDTRAGLTPDDAEEYAHAILAAVALARQPLPALSPRSSSEGGGRASTSPVPA